MADDRSKRKEWLHCKNAKIPRTTAWRSKTVEKGNLGECSTFDSSTRMSIDPEESAQSSSRVFENDSMLTFLNETDLQSGQSSTQPPTSTTESGDSDPANLEVEVDEFSSFFVDPESNSVACSSEESSESDTESSDCSSDSEFDGEQDETRDTIEEPAKSNEDLGGDDIPLYNGASVSRLGALVLVILFSLRHQLSGQALIDLVKVLHVLLPVGHRFVASAFLLKKYFADLFCEPPPKKHSYCGNCLGRIQNGQTECLKEKCQKSKKKIEHFLELDLHMRLCQLYRDAEFVRLLGYRFDNGFLDDDDICDIFSGQEYRKLMQPGGILSQDNPLNISFSFNTDGVAPYKSSNKQNFWPIFLVINELPPRLRCSRRYMFLAGLWCSKKKPNMQTFCRPIIESISGLYRSGLTVVTPTGQQKVIKATLLLSSADLPAKSLMANMKQFNGEKGCSVCEDKGETVGVGGLHRIWPYTSDMVLRTHKSVVASIRKVVKTGKPVNGIKGTSVFLLFKPFDLVKGFVIDWMHSVCLGVTKSMIHLWLTQRTVEKNSS